MNILLSEIINSTVDDKSIITVHCLKIEIALSDNRICEITLHDNGHPWRVSFYTVKIRSGKMKFELHRTSSEGPARRSWMPNGFLYAEEYIENGKRIKTQINYESII